LVGYEEESKLGSILGESVGKKLALSLGEIVGKLLILDEVRGLLVSDNVVQF